MKIIDKSVYIFGKIWYTIISNTLTMAGKKQKEMRQRDNERKKKGYNKKRTKKTAKV